MTSAILTGATGLIGCAIRARLNAENISVLVPKRGERLQDFPMVDYAIHAAGYGQPERFMEQPLATIYVATQRLNEVLGKVKRHGKAIFLSTSEIYSGSRNIPHTESDIGTTTPDHPRGCYIEGKRCGEAIIHIRRAEGKIDAKIARVSLVYGPTRWDDKRVMFDFIRQALMTGVIRMRDQGAAVRTYCYVEDAVTMLLNILMHGKHAVYNVGGTSRTSIAGLADMVAWECGATVYPPKEDAPMQGAPDEVAVDISRYAEEFGMPDFIPLESGLMRTIAAMLRKNLWHEGTAA